jgi:hypothetical protein
VLGFLTCWLLTGAYCSFLAHKHDKALGQKFEAGDILLIISLLVIWPVMLWAIATEDEECL